MCLWREVIVFRQHNLAWVFELVEQGMETIVHDAKYSAVARPCV